MPRPPILPTIDWKALFAKAKTFAEWKSAAESPENTSRITQSLEQLALQPGVRQVVENLTKPVYVIAFAEDWCGDVLRHVPALEKLAQCSKQVSIRYLTRQKAPEAFIRFLTNGGEAVPKFVFLSDAFVETGNWGPMPQACREVISRGKACGNLGAARKKTSAMYAADPGLQQVFAELAGCISVATSIEP